MFFLIFLFLAGCSKYYIAIEQQPVDAEYLASSHVDTPDPRQENPPFGQRLDISWHVPQDILKKKPELKLHLIYRNHTEEILSYPVKYRFGHAAYPLLNGEYERTGGLLTYKAWVVTQEGEKSLEWKHQLWVNLIQLNEETTSSSVDSQSRQGSVIDTPSSREEESIPSN